MMDLQAQFVDTKDADEIIPISWKCPYCGDDTKVDDFYWTCVPLCGTCEREVEWADLLTAEQMQTANDRADEYFLMLWR